MCKEIGKCPRCGSERLDYDAFELGSIGGTAYYPFTCNDCGFTGREWYDLNFSGYTDEDGEEMDENAIHYHVYETVDEEVDNLEFFKNFADAYGFLITLKENIGNRSFFADRWKGYGLNAEIQDIHEEMDEKTKLCPYCNSVLIKSKDGGVSCSSLMCNYTKMEE